MAAAVPMLAGVRCGRGRRLAQPAQPAALAVAAPHAGRLCAAGRQGPCLLRTPPHSPSSPYPPQCNPLCSLDLSAHVGDLWPALLQQSRHAKEAVRCGAGASSACCWAAWWADLRQRRCSCLLLPACKAPRPLRAATSCPPAPSAHARMRTVRASPRARAPCLQAAGGRVRGGHVAPHQRFWRDRGAAGRGLPGAGRQRRWGQAWLRGAPPAGGQVCLHRLPGPAFE